MDKDNTVIENGFVRFENGVIAEVGSGSCVPGNAETIYDFGGKSVYPGFIDAHTHLGMFEDYIGAEGEDGNEDSEPVTPHMRAIDAVNPMDRYFSEALSAGITSVLSSPGSTNPIAGQIAAFKTYGKCIDKMIIKAPAGIKFALGENPKCTFGDKDQSPITRMATAALIRETLIKAKHYCEEKKNSDGFDRPDYDMKYESLIPLLEKKIPAHFHVHRADDIFTALRIAGEFDIDCVLVHATEGHLIIDELKEYPCIKGVLSGPFLTDRSKPELKNLTPKSPGILARSHIPTAIITDHPETPVPYLLLCAAVAVREGMDRTAALRAITSEAAKIGGIDDRTGSIEKGKDADFAVFEGDPLNIMNQPVSVFVGGHQIF